MNRIVAADEAGLAAVAAVLNAGGVAVIPTDTVYGLAARPDFPDAVARLYTIKARDAAKPIAMLAADASDVPVRHALTAHWPGALTVVAGGEGYRVPNHDWTRRLIRACGGLLRVTSANLSGCRPAVDALQALAEIGLSTDIIADDGISPGGVASTVIRIDGEKVTILRQGPIFIPTTA